jgi:hypothetical protein
MDAHRPGAVTVVVVVLYIQGVFQILAGLFAFIERNDLDLRAHYDASSGAIATFGIVNILIGLIVLLLASALGRGSNFVRLFVGIISAVNLGVAVWGLIAFEGTARANSLWQALIAGLALYLLFGRPDSQAFFER